MPHMPSFGSLICLAVFGLIMAGIVLLIIFLAKKAGKGGTGAGVIIAIVLGVGFVLILLIALLISILVPNLNHVRVEAKKAKSSANLKQIYAGCLIYMNSYAAYPDSLSTMLFRTNYPADILVLPSSNETPLIGPASQISEASLVGHCSYIYAGKGLSTKALSEILAYENPADYRGKGTLFLHADGSIEWVGQPQVDALIQQLPAQTNVSPPAGGGSTTPY